MPDYDVVVVGSGPGGYVAAIRAGQLGMETAVVEQGVVGGVCLNWGCIPSKALLRSAEVLSLFRRADEFGISVDNLQYDFGKAVDRSRKIVRHLTRGVSYLLKKNHVEYIEGVGILKDKNTVQVGDNGRTLTANNVIIATGAKLRRLPALPVDGRVVITSREALELRKVPRRMLIVGGGAIGVEFAHLFRAYGAEVTIVEMLPHLVPLEDEEISIQLEQSFKRQGIKAITGSQVDDIRLDAETASVTVSNGDTSSVIECDKVLVAVGVQGNIGGIGLEELGIETERGFIVINDRMETNVPGVFAIGDVTGKLLLAHVASAQGVTAIEAIGGLDPPTLDYDLMPRATYCHPQVASLGLTEVEARNRGYTVKTGKFPFSASGKALALGEPEGMVKVVIDAKMGELLGAHMIGAEVPELLGELSLVKLLEGTTQELGWLVHPHPTISEMVKEAALASEGKAINI